jgi:thiazole synthase
MEEAILASGSEMVTVALKRIDLETETDAIISHLKHPHIHLLPNTSARNAKKLFCGATGKRSLRNQLVKTRNSSRSKIPNAGCNRNAESDRALVN